MGAPSAYSFRILGDAQVLADGRPLELGGRKLTALLALLVLHANEVVSTDRLVDELWGSEPPRTARKSLQVHVSRLRKALGEGVLQSSPSGYVLRVDPATVDLQRFEQLVEGGRNALRSGRPKEAAAAVREALGLWRGPALAGLEGEPFARSAAARLEDLRLGATELGIEADLALDRHASVIGMLERLISEHPFREGFRRQLMLALYRSGRQADALALYRETRRTFADELGVEPGPELRELESAVLRHDPSLALPAEKTMPRGQRSRRALAIAAGTLLAIAAAAAVIVTLRWTGASEEAAPRVVANSVVRIDPRTNEIVQVTPVGRDPQELAASAKAVWVVNRRDRTVTRVRPSGAVDTIGGVPYADHLAVDGSSVWVSSFDRASVARIDALTLEVVNTVGVPSQHAEGLALGGGYLWITNPAKIRGVGRETLSRLELRSGRVVSTIAVGKTPIFTTFGYGAVWVSNYDDGTVSVVAPGSPRAATVRVGDGPLGIDTGFGSVWVVIYWSHRLERIDARTRRVVARIPTGEGPLSVSAGEGAVWVTNRDSRSVSRIDPRTNKVVLTIRFPAPLSPQAVAAANGAVWVSIGRCSHRPCF